MKNSFKFILFISGIALSIVSCTRQDEKREGKITGKLLHARVQREQPMLSVDRAQNAFALRHFQDAERGLAVNGIKLRNARVEKCMC